MRTSNLLRLLMVAAAAATAFAQHASEAESRELTSEAAEVDMGHFAVSGSSHRLLKKKKHTPAPTPAADEEEDDDESGSGDAPAPAPAPASNAPAPASSAPAPSQTQAKKDGSKKDDAKKEEKKKDDAKATPAASSNAPVQTTAAPQATTAAPQATTGAPAQTPAATTKAPAPAATNATAPAPAKSPAPAPQPSQTPQATQASAPAPAGNNTDEKIKGNKNEGVIDHSSDGTSEIDKIDVKNKDKWESVYNDPPLLVIKASLYAFIAYNNTKVCDTFNMTLNAVERKAEANETFSYHVVTQINCTKGNEDQTKGKFVLNFVPEGKRLLLTECGHREAGEIMNWMDISGEVPQCMTPTERKAYISQPMKHVHASNGTVEGDKVAPTQLNFLAHLKLMDEEGVAIAGSATVILIAIIAVVVVFVARKRKAQKDLERTIAGAKAEHAVEDDQPVVAEASGTVERKGLMDSAKAKPTEVEEGSFVNSPSVRV